MKTFTELKKYIKENRESTAFYAVLFLSIICSIVSFLHFYSHGLTLAYGDAKSHLNIARRVIFSLTPGVTQIGGIWLPLPHVLDMLTIWNDFMYYSGISGSMISMASYVIAVLIIYKSVYFYTKSIVSSFIGAAVMMFNPAFLYFQTTAMTELPSIATALVATYLLIKWSRSDNLATLILAAIMTDIASLGRYDNWFFVVAAYFVVFIVELLRHKSMKIAEGIVLLFSVLASFGIFIWLLYNLVIFGNILNFANGVGSASWYASNQHAPTIHNLLLSLITFGWLMIDNIGVVPMCFILLGSILFFLKNKLTTDFIPPYLFIVPIIFNILSLYLGQSIVLTQHLPPYHLYNTRYGINALAAAAFFSGYLFYILKTKTKFLTLIGITLFMILIIYNYVFMFMSPLAILNDATNAAIPDEQKAANWLLQHPTNGLSLISTGTFDSLVFDAKIPENKLVYEGSWKLWDRALNNPKKVNIERIFVGRNIVFSKKSDPVGEKVLGLKELHTDYHIVFSNSYVTVYEKN